LSDQNKDNAKDNAVSSSNIFRITDELVRQVDRTKRMVLIMILVVIIGVPLSWHLAPFVKGIPFSAVGYAAIGTAIVFVAIGVRQWSVLSKWTKRYESYKEMQKKIDEQLDFEKGKQPEEH
jgi:Na+-driven multidrug efflux pump